MAKVILHELEYEIDEYGNITKRRGKGFLKCHPDKDGYLKVSIKTGGTTYNEFLHRVVFRTFSGEIPDGMTVDHIDKDKSHNHKDNLQLMTSEDNAAKGNQEDWIISPPNGEEFIITNLSKFCRENNLHDSHIVTHSYKGWKARKHVE